MTRVNSQVRMSFVSKLQREFPDKDVSNIASLILRHGTTYGRIQEIWCSEELTERQEKRLQHKELLLERRITQLCQELDPGCTPLFEGDPRGNTVKILLPSGYSDSWGGKGFCVPTS